MSVLRYGMVGIDIQGHGEMTIVFSCEGAEERQLWAGEMCPSSLSRHLSQGTGRLDSMRFDYLYGAERAKAGEGFWTWQ